MKRKHKVFLQLDNIAFELSIQDAVFVVYSGKRRSDKLGELRVSRGAIEWIPGGGRIRRRLRWPKFHSLMQEHADRARRRLLGSRVNVSPARRRRR